MFKNLFIPTESNNYTPHLLNRKAFVVYLVLLIILNIFGASLGFTRAEAAVDFTSIYQAHNDIRSQNGLNTLTINTSLNESATAKAQVMLENDCWAHYCPPGVSPWTFFDDAGYVYIYAGENLAEGFESNDNVMSAWMNSPTHRANIINPNFNEIGIGFAYGDYQGIENNTIIVVHFGSTNESLSDQIFDQLPETGSSPVNIDYPVDNSQISESQPEIKGTAPIDSRVDIYDGSGVLGRVDAAGDSFTYRPESDLTEGEHTISATAFDDQNIVLGTSNAVSFTVDLQAPDILLKTLTVSAVEYDENDESAIVSVMTEGNADALILEQASKPFYQAGEDNWELSIDLDFFRINDTVVLVATDEAGNITREEIGSKAVLAEALAKINDPLIEKDQEGIIGSFWGNILGKDTQAKVNIGFMLFLSGLFVIDFAVLSKSGMTGIKRSKSHLHLSSVLLIIVIAIIGGMSGNILNGITN